MFQTRKKSIPISNCSFLIERKLLSSTKAHSYTIQIILLTILLQLLIYIERNSRHASEFSNIKYWNVTFGSKGKEYISFKDPLIALAIALHPASILPSKRSYGFL